MFHWSSLGELPVIWWYISKKSQQKSSPGIGVVSIQTELLLPHTGISMNYWSYATPGSGQTPPREAPVRRVVHRRLFFRRQIIGLMCGKGVEPPRGCGTPRLLSGARESQVFFAYIITKIFSNISLDITTTEEHDIIWIRTYEFSYSPHSGKILFPCAVNCCVVRNKTPIHSAQSIQRCAE